jgi:hypothetical protein
MNQYDAYDNPITPIQQQEVTEAEPSTETDYYAILNIPKSVSPYFIEAHSREGYR